MAAPGVGAWPLGCVALAPVLLASRKARPGRAFLLGGTAGFTFFASSSTFMVSTLQRFTGWPELAAFAVAIVVWAGGEHRGVDEASEGEMKKVQRRSPTKGNVAKAKSFAWASWRVDDAIGNGYFIEAVAIEESVISDRLFSYLSGKSKTVRAWKERKAMLGKLLEQWEKTQPPPKLLAAAHAWRALRNDVVHGVAKSAAGAPTKDVDEMLKNAEHAARSGGTLMREVMAWHKKELAADRKAQKATS